MIIVPRSRVLILVVPVLILLLVTYPYFRSFSRPRAPSHFFGSEYSPPQGYLSNSGESHPSSEHRYDNDAVHGIPVLDTHLHESFHGSGDRPTSSATDDIHEPRPNPVDADDDDDDTGRYEYDVVPSGLSPSASKAAATNHPQSHKDTQDHPGDDTTPSGPKPFPKIFGNHPIDDLIKTALGKFKKLKKKESNTLEEAAAAYRAKRGRHPPPGFDKWYGFAKEKGSLIIEDFFDPIYQDTEPFWGREPESIRAEPNTWGNVITIRKGEAKTHNNRGGAGWIRVWIDMLRPIQEFLPDMDLAVNTLDEPRVVVPWELINDYMEKARKHKNLDAPAKLVTQYQSLAELSQEDLAENQEAAWQSWHENTPYWDLARQACHPDSVARDLGLDSNLTLPPEFTQVFVQESHRGYVANYTFSKNACLNPHLRNVHGNFVRPRFVSMNVSLFPMLAGSKHEGITNEIRIPAAKYWSSGKLFGGEDDVSTVDPDGPKGASEFESTIPWSGKTSSVFWRGSASGGEHNKTTWRRFQRHRFISMLNSTQVTMTERKLEDMSSLSGEDLLSSDPPLPHNFPIPNTRLYPIKALASHPTKLGAWLSNLTDAAFTHMMCFPQSMSTIGAGKRCVYTDPFYGLGEQTPLAEAYNHKYLPDIDGNGYSGRYRAFLRSGSLPIKATVHAEWHDSRLIPWVHFVPMDNTFVDFYSILEYFTGNPDADEGGGGLGNFLNEWLGWAAGGHDGGGTQGHRFTGGRHDEMAQAIAECGRDWAQKVLRKEDMVVYMYRLLLEWARITNDRRDEMGWAGDFR